MAAHNLAAGSVNLGMDSVVMQIIKKILLRVVVNSRHGELRISYSQIAKTVA